MFKVFNSRFVGIILFLLLFIFALIIPFITGLDPNQQNLMNTFSSFNSTNLLGTDNYGRDFLTRLAYATRLSFLLSLFIIFTAGIPGVLLGILAACKKGIVEKSLVLFSDIILALPGLLLVLLFIAFAPGDFLLIYIGLSLYFWVEFFKTIRAKTKSILLEPYIESTKLLGFSFFYILRKQIFPQLYATIFTLATFSMSSAIISISTLSALNVGLRPPTAELGSMIVELMPYFEDDPIFILLPSSIIFLLILSLQLIAKRNY